MKQLVEMKEVEVLYNMIGTMKPPLLCQYTSKQANKNLKGWVDWQADRQFQNDRQRDKYTDRRTDRRW